MTTNSIFFEIILTVHPTKWENAFENLNDISFATWAVTKNPNFQVFVASSAQKKIEWLSFFSPLVSANGAENQNSVHWN